MEADAKVWEQYVRACLVLEPVEAALDTITATMSDYQLSSETVQSILRPIRAQIAEKDAAEVQKPSYQLVRRRKRR